MILVYAIVFGKIVFFSGKHALLQIDQCSILFTLHIFHGFVEFKNVTYSEEPLILNHPMIQCSERDESGVKSGQLYLYVNGIIHQIVVLEFIVQCSRTSISLLNH